MISDENSDSVVNLLDLNIPLYYNQSIDHVVS